MLSVLRNTMLPHVVYMQAQVVPRKCVMGALRATAQHGLLVIVIDVIFVVFQLSNGRTDTQTHRQTDRHKGKNRGT